ncbi:MAG: PQQ-binding-like beta-propeller repeat protein, partial [Eubacteriales bacterium]|nr:PQQ-binding-like beta-propeller repeat protein [Eubacteriales bacterium]
YEVPDLTYTTAAEVGCYASPVVGQNSVSDLVFFTVTNGETNATVYALSKSNGSVVWSQTLESPTVSSPVAVYNLLGDAWLIQAESSGKMTMMNAKTGAVLSTLQLDGKIESSPSVYRDVLVISTTGTDSSYIYGIKLE